MSLIIFGMIFNTAIGLFYSLARRFSTNEKNFKIVIIGLVIAGFILSFAGFKKLVSIMYPLLGYAGIVFVIHLMYIWFINRKVIKREENIRTRIFNLFNKKHDENLKYTKMDENLIDHLTEKSIIDNDDISDDIEKLVKESLDDNNE